jgi:hypothetical protein
MMGILIRPVDAQACAYRYGSKSILLTPPEKQLQA